MSIKDELSNIVRTVKELCKEENDTLLCDIIDNCKIVLEEVIYDNWNGGSYYYPVSINLSPKIYSRIGDKVNEVENSFKSKFDIVTISFANENEYIYSVKIVPKSKRTIDWNKLYGVYTKKSLLNDINSIKEILVDVFTKKYEILSVEIIYKDIYNKVNNALKEINVENPNKFNDILKWYNTWTAFNFTDEDLIKEIDKLYKDCITLIDDSEEKELAEVFVNLKGWDKVKYSLQNIKTDLDKAQKEDQFQAIGLYSRELIISLAQEIYDENIHVVLDNKKISKTDANGMFNAYISKELAGSSNENIRKYIKNTLSLANELVHKRTATKREAALCVNAIVALVNFFGIIEKRY
ncbi:MAG: hypothetical protein N4A32_08225 [Marinifilaceae bacterium]|nr:hypothetical protein [Marinifilaceae bacterium]